MPPSDFCSPGADNFSVTASAQNAPATRQEELRQQRELKSKSIKPYKPGSLEGGTLYVQKERLLERFAEGWKGFHPVLGGMSTGSGFAGGVRYEKAFCGWRTVLQNFRSYFPAGLSAL